MDLTQTVLFLLVALVMGWFAVGVIWNIRRGNAVLRWMQSGLPRLGERTTLRWLGSSVVELAIARAKPPFRRVELMLVMEPRDVLWFWLFARWRGRRDTLIIRAHIAHPPPYEFDCLAPGSWSAHEHLGRGEARLWEPEPLEGAHFRAPTATRSLSRPLVPALLQAARRVQPVVWRLSARREYPQLELHVSLPDPKQAEAGQFFSALRALAEQLGSPQRPA